MKKTSKIFMALALSVCLCLTAVLFVGCGAKKPLTDQALTGEVIADFSDGKVGSVFASDGWTNGSVFNVVWKASNVTYSDGAMHLGIKEEAASAWVDGESVDYQYTGGEARTTMHYGFGDYEVSMKPAKKVGTASTFFVCTGSYDLVDGVENPWDEIDIEFLGQDTTRVQFNYFVNGVGGHEHMYDLGFDASEQYHTYGFRWTENYIVWFVDGEPVYKVKASSTKAMPSAPGRILMNYWCGNEDAEGWMGKFSGAETGETVDYKWIKTSAEASYVDGEAPVEPVEPGDDTSELVGFDLSAATFNGETADYNVTQSDGALIATYENIAGNSYKNINTDVKDFAADKVYVTLKITNNGENQANVRIDLDSETKVSETTAANTDAKVEGEGASVYTDTTWGGSVFTIPAGATVTATVYFDNVRIVKTLMFYFDSSKYDDVGTHTGSITLSECAFAKAEQGEQPEQPPEVITMTGFDLSAAEVNGDTDVYTVAQSDGALIATYENIAGNSYKNINTDIKDFAADKKYVTLKITNSGENQANVRIDLDSETKVSETTAANTDAKVEGEGASVYTDTTWGGSVFTIPAGATVTATVYFDNARIVKTLMFYFDSSKYDDEGTHTGSITLSECAFAKAEQGEQPEQPVDNTVALSFGSTEIYTVTPSGEAAKSVTVTYSEVGGQSYKTISAYIGTVASGSDTFTVTIRNNGEAAVRLRFDVQGTTQVGNTAAINTNAWVNSEVDHGVYTDTTWGGSFVTVAAGEEVVLTVIYDESTEKGAVNNLIIFIDSATDNGDTHSGNVTISQFTFTKSVQASDAE